jgi:hypothetical protein
MGGSPITSMNTNLERLQQMIDASKRRQRMWMTKQTA